MNMVSAWWLIAEAFGMLAIMILTRNMAYRHGIWDGAFNQFLPVVRREMLFYDAHRARQIFASENQPADEQNG